MHSLEHHQHLLFYLRRQLYASCLKAMHPVVNLILFHGIEYVAELLDVAVTVFLGICALETVQFLIIEVQIAVVVSLCTVRMPAAAYTILTAMFMVVMLIYRCVPVEFTQDEESGDNEYQDAYQYEVFHVICFEMQI